MEKKHSICSFFSCMSHELAQDGVTFARELFNPKI